MVIAKRLRPGRDPIQIQIFRAYVRIKTMVRKGGFELLHQVDNTYLIDLASALTAKCPTIPLPLYVYCTANALWKRDSVTVFLGSPPLAAAAIRHSQDLL